MLSVEHIPRHHTGAHWENQASLRLSARRGADRGFRRDAIAFADLDRGGRVVDLAWSAEGVGEGVHAVTSAASSARRGLNRRSDDATHGRWVKAKSGGICRSGGRWEGQEQGWRWEGQEQGWSLEEEEGGSQPNGEADDYCGGSEQRTWRVEGWRRAQKEGTRRRKGIE